MTRYVPNPFRFDVAVARAYGSLVEVTSGNVTLALPSGAEGQLLVATIAFRGAATFAMPSGWTQAQQVTTADTATGGQVSGLVAYKIRGPAEGSAGFTRTGGNRALGFMYGYTPSRGGLAFDTSSANAQASATTALAGTALTVADPNSLLFVLTVVAGGDGAFGQSLSAASLSAPASVGGVDATVSRSRWEEINWVSQGSTSPLVAGHAFDLAGVPAGSTGAFSATSSVSSRGLMIAAAFSLT